METFRRRVCGEKSPVETILHLSIQENEFIEKEILPVSNGTIWSEQDSLPWIRYLVGTFSELLKVIHDLCVGIYVRAKTFRKLSNHGRLDRCRTEPSLFWVMQTNLTQMLDDVSKNCGSEEMKRAAAMFVEVE